MKKYIQMEKIYKKQKMLQNKHILKLIRFNKKLMEITITIIQPKYITFQILIKIIKKINKKNIS